MNDFNGPVIEEFRANHGKVGGYFEGQDLLLLTTKGRKSGREHTTPVMYSRDGDRLLVYASAAGAAKHPDWYENLVANPDVVVEVGDERYEARAAPLEGEDRDRAYAAQAERLPQFAEYEEKAAGRTIPVVALTRQ
jgi:deazaflavin-dependent oxidoreductase (nitroreductase family)